jgi:hypothetical protein
LTLFELFVLYSNKFFIKEVEMGGFNPEAFWLLIVTIIAGITPLVLYLSNAIKADRKGVKK